MKRLRYALLTLCLLPFVYAQQSGTGGEPAGEVEGLVTLQSANSLADTEEELTRALEENGLTVFTVIDHAANAEEAGLDLLPTRLVVFGNPNLGTLLMKDARSVAIDLPQKMLLWEDADGNVFVSYNDPAYLAERHGLTGVDDTLATISGALQNLAGAATAP